MFSSILYQVVAFLLAAALVPLTFRAFEAFDYNIINLTNSLIALVSSIFVAPALHAVSRFYNRDRDGVFTYYRAIAVFALPSVFFSYFATQIAFADELNNFGFFSLVVCLLLLLDGTKDSILSYLNVNEKRHLYGVLQNLNFLIRLALISIIYVCLEGKETPYYYYFLSMVAASLITILFASSRFSVLCDFRSSIKRDSKFLSQEELAFAKGFGVISLFSWAQNWLDKWFLSFASNEVSSDILASYLSSSQIIYAPYQLLLSVVLVHYGPKLYHALNTKHAMVSDRQIVRERLTSVGFYFLLIALTGFVVSVPLLKPLSELILGPSFKVETATLIVVSGYAAGNSFAGLMAYVLQTLKMFRAFMVIQAVSTVVLCLALIPLVKNYGVLGAAVALVVVTIMRVLLMIFVFVKYEPS